MPPTFNIAINAVNAGLAFIGAHFWYEIVPWIHWTLRYADDIDDVDNIEMSWKGKCFYVQSGNTGGTFFLTRTSFWDGLLCAVFHCIIIIFKFLLYGICICIILQMYLYLHYNSIVFVFDRRPGQAERTIPGCEQDLHKTAINSSKLPSLHLIYIVGWWEQWWCGDDSGDGVAYFTSLALSWYVWMYQ